MEDYLNKLSQLQNLFLTYLDIKLDEINEEEINYKNLIQFLTQNEILTNKSNLKIFLKMIVVNANNHYRLIHFYPKLDLILSSMKKYILQHYSNEEIFEIFRSNKRLLLYLLEEKVLYFDDMMKNELSNENKYFDYCQYLQKYLELSDNVRIRIKLDEKCQKEGENCDTMAKLIRQDKLNDFIHEIETNRFTFNSDIGESIYETNQFLRVNIFPRFNEYAAFFGSINIFKYLCMNKAQFHPIIWKDAIHGRNYEIIHIIENQEIFSYKYNEFDDVEGNMKEAIKCHHNEIAGYYYDHYCSDLDIDINFAIIEECFNSFNFSFLIEYLKDKFLDALNTKIKSILNFLTANDYDELISILLKQNDRNIDIKLVFNLVFYEDILSDAIQNNSYRTIEFLLTRDDLDINEKIEEYDAKSGIVNDDFKLFLINFIFQNFLLRSNSFCNL